LTPFWDDSNRAPVSAFAHSAKTSQHEDASVMAVQELTGAPSRRFIRAYLVVWGVGAVLALGYLGTLAWQPEQLSPVQPKVSEPEPGLSAAARALAEVGTVRQTIDTLQRDVGDLKGSVEQRGDQERTLQSRVTALEERVATLPSVVTTTTTPANIVTVKPQKASEPKMAEKVEPKAAEKVEPKAAEKVEPKAAEKTEPKAAKAAATKPVAQKAGAPRVITVPNEEMTPANSTRTPGGKTPLETGSITQPEIVFGEAVVTRAEELYAVQLDTATSLQTLRMRWGVLVERHGATLATLQPRYVAPRVQGGQYRLLAGPLTSTAAAREVCGELRAQLPLCSTTDFGGEPL
jgi:hypothetical protein